MSLHELRRAPVEETAIVRLIVTRQESMDRGLPEWARRSNPVVRRHLGAYWKTIVPDARQIGRWLLVQSGLALLTLPFPWLLTLIMPAVTVSLFLLPVAFAMYARNMTVAAIMAAEWMAQERRNQTLDVLRVTPRPLSRVLASKAAAAVWRQVEDLNVVVIAVALLTMPVLIVEYGILYGSQAGGWHTVIGVIAGMFASCARIFLEPVMAASVGVFLGAVTPPIRHSAGTITVGLVAGYFALINLARLLPLDFWSRVAVESILPVILPAAIAIAALRGAAWALERDQQP
jgi:hypothetical protein